MNTPGVASAVLPSPMDELARQIWMHFEEIGSQVASAKIDELAVTLAAARQQMTKDEPATVVFAGEPCNGKSRLMNALLGRPGLLPVDPDVSTGIHVVVGSGAPEQGYVSFHDRDVPLAVPLADLGAYVSVEHNPANTRGVIGVEVALESPILENLRLVDTPGVGGLDAAHGRYTLAALKHADALVMVVDAGGPLSQPELTFLDAAAACTDVVLITMTKIDNHPGWEDVRQEDLELLARFAPSLATVRIQPVSARMAELGLGSGPRAAAAREESRLDELTAWLVSGVALRRRRVRLRNGIGQAVAVAEALLARMDAFLATVGDLSGSPEDLRARAAALEETKRNANAWRSRFANAMTRAESRAANEIARQSMLMRRRLERELEAEWTDALRDRIPHELQLEVNAAKVEIEDGLTADLRSAFDEVLAATGVPTVEMPPIEFGSVSPFMTVIERGRKDRGGDAVRAVRQVLTTGISFMMGTALGLMRVVVAVAGVSLDTGSAQRARDRQEARNWITDTLGEWSRDATLTMRDGVRDSRLHLEEMLSEAIRDRITREETVLAELSARKTGADEQRRQQTTIVAAKGRLSAARDALLALRDAPELAVST